MADAGATPDLDALLARLPHGEPMRLVERLTAVEPGQSAVGVRTVRADDWFFQGHFPGHPVVPAIVLIELLAQTGGLAVASGTDRSQSGMRLAGVHAFKFPAPAGPGCRLVATAFVRGRMGPLVRVEGEVTADGLVVATGSITLAASA